MERLILLGMKVSDGMDMGWPCQTFSFLFTLPCIILVLYRYSPHQIRSFFPSDGHEHGDLKALSIPSLTSTLEY